MKSLAPLAFVAALAAAGPAFTQTTPAERAREAAAMLMTAGYQIRGSQILNMCGRPVQPRPAAIDLNGDGRAEAVIPDTDPTCYGDKGEAFAIIQRQGPANWALVGKTYGRLKLLETRTNGWRDYTLEGPGCQRTWTYQPDQGYVSLKPCPSDVAARPAAAAPTPPTKPTGSPADRAAAFKAAGFSSVRGKYPTCNKSQELEIEFRDLNRDGRLDAVVTDYGTECFGMTGQGFVIVTKDASGAWRQVFGSQGIPTFLATRGVGGWPDIENGGPGFCHPILRWNGSDYVRIRSRAESPGGCANR